MAVMSMKIFPGTLIFFIIFTFTCAMVGLRLSQSERSKKD